MLFQPVWRTPIPNRQHPIAKRSSMKTTSSSSATARYTLSWDKRCNPCLYTLHLTLYTKIALVAIFVCIYQKKTLPLHGFCCFYRMNTQILKFTIFCISNIAERLQISARDVYHKMVQTDVISAYIIPCYDVLHSFSKEYIVEDLISYMRKKGVTL